MPMLNHPDKLLSFSNGLLVVAAVLTVIATISVIYFGNRVATLKAAQLKTYQDDADNRIAEAKAEAAQARARVDDRTISKEQFAIISETLRSLPIRSVQVVCVPGNEEAFGYAKALARVLESAQWRTTGGGTIPLPTATPYSGVVIFADLRQSEASGELRDALAKANIRANINVTYALPGALRLYVGQKP